MTLAALIYPHQLYEDHPALVGTASAVMVEDPLLFSQFPFHRQKLILHRATMTHYASRLQAKGFIVHYIEAGDLGETGRIAEVLKAKRIGAVQYVDPCDDWLSTRLAGSLARRQIAATVLEEPHFLTPASVMRDFAIGRRRLFFTEFYIAQRRRLGLLLENDGTPLGGQWSFDAANRK